MHTPFVLEDHWPSVSKDLLWVGGGGDGATSGGNGGGCPSSALLTPLPRETKPYRPPKGIPA